MARTAIPLYVTGQLVTSAHGNTYWRDNEAAHWAAIAAAGGAVLIEEKLLGAPAASFDFVAIPATYRHLKIILNAQSSAAAGASINIIFNNDGGNNYDYERLTVYGTGPGTIAAAEYLTRAAFNMGTIPGNTANYSGSSEYLISSYRDTNFKKTIMHHGLFKYGTLTTNVQMFKDMGGWRSTAAINRITFTLSVDSFNTGSIASLYGLV